MINLYQVNNRSADMGSLDEKSNKMELKNYKYYDDLEFREIVVHVFRNSGV